MKTVYTETKYLLIILLFLSSCSTNEESVFNKSCGCISDLRNIEITLINKKEFDSFTGNAFYLYSYKINSVVIGKELVDKLKSQGFIKLPLRNNFPFDSDLSTYAKNISNGYYKITEQNDESFSYRMCIIDINNNLLISVNSQN